MYQLKERFGNTALITGASAGIGKAFSYALAKEGMNLILVARRAEALQQIAEDLQQQFGVAVQVLPQDLQEKDAAKTIQSNIKWPVDLLINNAGFGSYGRFQDLDVSIEENMVDLNCKLTVSLTHALLPSMLERKKGGIIFLSSMVGHMPAPYMATYSATKAFDRFFALSLAGELKNTNIAVLSVHPGDTVSEFREQAHFDKALPGRPRTVENVVHTALSNLGKRPSAIDGLGNRIFGFITRIWPEKRVVNFTSKIWKP